jgi:hypothetical protein
MEPWLGLSFSRDTFIPYIYIRMYVLCGLLDLDFMDLVLIVVAHALNFSVNIVTSLLKKSPFPITRGETFTS